MLSRVPSSVLCSVISIRRSSFSFAFSAITCSPAEILSSLKRAAVSVSSSVFVTVSTSSFNLSISALTSSISRFISNISSITPFRFSSILANLVFALPKSISFSLKFLDTSSILFSRSDFSFSSASFSSSMSRRAFSSSTIDPESSFILASLFTRLISTALISPPEIKPFPAISPTSVIKVLSLTDGLSFKTERASSRSFTTKMFFNK